MTRILASAYTRTSAFGNRFLKAFVTRVFGSAFRGCSRS